jgi:hypothetical protein
VRDTADLGDERLTDFCNLPSVKYTRVSISLYEIPSWSSAMQPKPAIISRKAPPEEFVRKGSSPQWLCYVTECLQCGRFFRLKWPAGVEKFEETDVVHAECPSCLFEFAKTGDKLWGWDFAAMVLAGRVTRVEEVKAR